MKSHLVTSFNDDFVAIFKEDVVSPFELDQLLFEYTQQSIYKIVEY